MKVQLTEDVISNNRKTVYGKKGECVKSVVVSETVLIVENQDGNRYPVSILKTKELK
jgi:hypothetical protein